MTKTHERFLSKNHIYRDLTIGLGLLLILSPILDHYTTWTKVDSYLTVAFLIFALYEISRRTADLVIGLALGIPAVAGGIFNAATPDTPAYNLIPVVLSAAFLGYLIWRILKDVSTSERISSEKVFGAVCAYLLIGFLFASIYGFISLTDHDAFAASEALEAELETEYDQHSFAVYTYFSFVTMSTLGYGDIAPVSPVARSFAWFQAVLGQLYLAITIAALVGVHIARSRD